MPTRSSLPACALVLAAVMLSSTVALAQRLKPEGDIVEATVSGLKATPNGDGQAVILRSKETPPREVEIWIGPTEAMTIQLRLLGRRYPRPLTHDLLQTMLDKVDARSLQP